MSAGPPFDYTTEIDISLYKKANWKGFFHFTKALYQKFPIFAAIFAIGYLAAKFTTGTSTVTNLLSLVCGIGLAVCVFGLLVYILLIRQQAKAIDKLCREMVGKTFHTTLTENAVTIRNPNSGAVKTYPYTMLSVIIDDPDFYLLKAENEALFFGKIGMQSAGALEFFHHQLTHPKAK